ncbi:MAG: nucleoside triphosphate pyrophosphohydrolase, partial [Gammaproteobacteria bacterium]
MEHMNQLLGIMKSLRDPDGGCPWDIEQKFSTIAPYTIEEAYEVADAITRDDMDGLCSELGDLLFQVVYHAQLADEQGFFDFNGVTEKINEKLIRRHPHVFANTEITDAKAQSIAWEAIKAQERLDKQGKADQEDGLQQEKLLGGINQAMPSLSRAQKLQDRAATVGFDWNDPQAVLDKIKEEIMEVEEEIDSETRNAEKIEDEIGDLLFACVNLARHFKIDSESAVRKTNKKFERR